MDGEHVWTYNPRHVCLVVLMDVPEKKLKILYLITKSNFGGAQKYVYELAVAAKGAGYVVAVARGGTGKAGAARGLLAEKLSDAAIPVYPIRNFLRDMSLWRDVRALIEVWRLILKVRPDILHVTSSKAGGIGALAGRLAGCKRIIFTSHGLTMDETWRPRWQRLLIYIGTWLTLQLAHHSIMISTETLKRSQRLPSMQNRVSLIYNGIGELQFNERTNARTTLDREARKNQFWIGGIGELHPNKNWSAAVEALLRLPQNAHLYIIGEGEERTHLEMLAEQFHVRDRLHLLGYVDAAASYLHAFDVFVLPSQKEGLPYVLLEAGAAEVAVVASDLPGNRDIIKTGEHGLLVSPEPDVIATSVEMLMRDEGMRRRYAAALRTRVQNTFSLSRMTSATFALYDSSTSRVS